MKNLTSCGEISMLRKYLIMVLSLPVVEISLEAFRQDAVRENPAKYISIYCTTTALRFGLQNSASVI